MSNEISKNLVLNFLNPPRRTSDSHRVILFLKWIFSGVNSILAGKDYPLCKIAEESENLNAVFDEIISDIDSQKSVINETINAPKPQVTKNTVYAELHRMSNTSSYPEIHLPVLAAVFSSILTSNTMRIGGRLIPSSNIQSCLLEIRRLVNKPIAIEGRSRLSIYNNLKNNKPDIPGVRTESIRRLLGISLNLEFPQHRISGANIDNGEHETFPNSAPYTILDFNDGSVGPIQLHRTQSTQLGTAQIREFRAYGLQVSDSVTEVNQVRSDIQVPSPLSVEPSSNRQNRRKVGAALQRSNQSLSTQWGKLNNFDIAILVGETLDISMTSHLHNQLTLLILLSLMTGRPYNEALHARLYSTSDSVPENLHTTPLAICPSGGFWQGTASLPGRERQLNPLWETNLNSSTNQVQLPLPTMIQKTLSCNYTNNRSGQIFKSSDHEEITRSAKNFLSKVNRRFGTRLTLTRIHQTLFNALTDGGGDMVDAMFITGQKPSNGHHSGAFYYNIRNTYLADRYRAIVGRVLSDTTAESHCTDFQPAPSVTIGSPLSPKTDRLPLLIADLKAKIEIAKQSVSETKRLYALHNAYTLYTVFMILFATGYRAVVSPLSRQSDLDRESGVIVIADKIGSDLNHARIVPIPEVVLDQLANYTKHRKRMDKLLNLFHSTEAPIQQLFFMHHKKDRPISVTPSNIDKHANEFFDLPLNVNRHFLRGALIANGVNPEVVDAYLGHWSIGQEPMSKYSTLNPTNYRNELIPALDQLLSEIGFLPLRGLV